MKKYRTTIITLAVVALAVIALLLVKNFNGKGGNTPQATEKPTPKEEYANIFDVKASDIVKISSNFKDSYELTKNGEEWTCTNHDNIKVYSSSVTALANNLTAISGGIIGDVSVDLSDYGFKDGVSDTFVEITTADGKTTRAYLGDFDFSKNYRYVIVAGDDKTVYKVNKFSADNMCVAKEDLVYLKIFDYSQDDTPYSFNVLQNGEKALELLWDFNEINESDKSIIWHWKATFPIERDSNYTKVNELITAMKNLSLNGIAKENVPQENLAEFGLAPAAIEYNLYMKRADGSVKLHKIRVGNKDESGEYYFCTIDDGVEGAFDVYTISIASVYRTISPLDYINTFLYMVTTDDVSSIDIDFGGEKHTMKFIREGEGDDLRETCMFDGKEAPNNDEYALVTANNRFDKLTEEDKALNNDSDFFNDVTTKNPEEAFRWLILSLYADLEINEFNLEEPAAEALGEMIFSVKYTENDKTTTEIKLFKRDNTTAYAYVNGVYAGGWVRTTKLYGDSYLDADFAITLTGLKKIMDY